MPVGGGGALQGGTEAHAELVEDLIRLVTSRLLDPLEILLDSPEQLPSLQQRVRSDAEMWASQLLGADHERAVSMASRLLAALYPGDTAFDPPEWWWRTPLGRVTACRLGHPARQAVSYAVAGAMLGITRQGVHDLANRHKLRRHPDGGIDTTSIRDRLATTANQSKGQKRV